MPEPATPLPDPGVDLDAEERRMREDAEEDARSGLPLEVIVFETLEAAEPAWRALETAAVTTPYQRYDWLKALVEARGISRARLAIAVVEQGGAPLALLPLAITRRFGLSLATFIGADIANMDWMPVLPSAAPRFDRVTLDRLLHEIGRQAGGIDVLSLRALPASWQGVDNPLLAYPHQPGPDHLYLAPLEPGARPNGKRLRNIMRGKRRLEELMGPVELRAATTPAAIAEFHRVFLKQRAARFAEQGIANIFGEDWFVRFFVAAARQALGAPRPALRFHALYAGNEIVATSCGTCAGTHFSQYINSMTTGPAAKSSLMGLLMSELVADLAREGMTSIDMGLGDFDYKLDWTDRTVVYDAVIPLTARGRLAAALLRGQRRLRRIVKQNDPLFGTYKRLRAALGRRRRQG